MASVLPSLKDSVRHLKNGPKFVGEILLFDPSPVVIAKVYGKTLNEMRKRKHIMAKALAAELNK
jgi:hypothetical protein